MRWAVVCPKCSLNVVEKTEDAATALRRRHHGLVGHRADITRILDTPLEGLIA